jgi:hypothetical protein
MAVTIVTDNSWDNYAKIIRRVNNESLKINKINFFYGKNMKFINKLCIKNDFNLFRRSVSDKNFIEDIKEVLMYSKFCIIFHNFVEYNTLSSYIIEICNLNKIPYFIFSEHCNDFYYNGEYITSKKFKNLVKEIEYNKWEINVIPEYYPDFSKESKESKEKESKEKESIAKFFENYETIQSSKKLNRIVFIN